MKTLLWTLFALAAILWTGAAALLAAAFRAISEAMANGSAADLAGWVSTWSVPNWLIAFVDVRWIQTWQVMLVQVLDQLPKVWPWLAEPISWAVPAIWVGWALVLLVLLALTLGLHVLVSKTGHAESGALKSSPAPGAVSH